ncbi:hypothetical protein [Paludisphaera borealis]|uniref:Uncharacterized protein n=1 Tax=Paludisphaera borealis TaxID=1387353 RepID=A0A1U7CPX9_9BACT|nr:hypothetical protein [Paludisphaera borealis]APW60933.1 hypothetical protein BSF38_02427 [Paludisphaera borealis]
MKIKTGGIGRSWNLASRLAAVGVVGLVSTGCQFSEEDTKQVRGKVSYHGEPVRGGSVFLLPESGMSGAWGAGVIRDDGSFVVESARSAVPLAAGTYGVTFTRANDGKPSNDERLPNEGTTLKSSAAAAHKNDIPEKYLDFAHPVFSINLGDMPIQVEITLRD